MEAAAWWTPKAQELVLAVQREVMRNYHVDPDRVFLSGMSNGGIGTYLIGLNHADQFAALIFNGGALDPLRYWIARGDCFISSMVQRTR
jgi:poly(3-hydroxybutyrate) depolymerase